MMLPSWFTKLRDVNAGSKQAKQPDKQHGSPPATSKQQHKAPASLAKSFSLRRASTKARNARFESDILDACRSEDNVRPSFSSSDSDLWKGVQSSPGVHKESTVALSINQGTIQLDGCEPKGTSPADVDKNVESWDSDTQFIGDCKGDTVSNMSPGIESLPSTQKLGLVISDNDVEDSPLTSETSSSFGSDMSSAHSSVSTKCSSCEEEGLQGNRIWQEGFRSSDCTCRSMQKDCEKYLEVKVSEKLEERSRCANLITRLSQENAKIRRNLSNEPQRGRQGSSFSSSMGSDGSSFLINANKSSSASSEIRKTCTSMTILIERNVNESRSRLEGDVECALRDNSALKQMAVDIKMPFKSNGRRKMKASPFTLDKPSQCSLQDERENALSVLGTPKMTTGSVLGAHQMSLGDNPGGKCGTLQIQRRRQRGSSISAVLPPDLQGVVGDSLAFVKISDDPYEDFRQSMYEMIMEKDLEGSVDVEELLYCYLTLNSPEHHELIKEVFSDVWSAVLMKMR